MDKQLIVAGLDLGTSAIKCVIGVRHEDGRVDVLGTGTHPARGLQQGTVCDQEQAVASIRAAVEEAELMAGCEIKEVFLAVSGRHIESFNSHGMVRIRNQSVDAEDVRACIDMARAVRLPPDQQILHVVPQEYLIDGQTGIARPLGMNGVRLEVHAHLITGHTESLLALEDCCKRARLKVLDVMHAPLAQAEVLLTPQGRDLGVVLIDIGGDTTNIAVFDRGEVVHTSIIGLGGEHVTRDVRDCLNAPLVEAEHLKQSRGCALAELIDPEEMVEIPGVGGRKPRRIERQLLCQIVEARVDEIFHLVSEELHRLGYTEGLRGGAVLTGGTANLPGAIELAEHVLHMPAAKGEPKALHGLVDVVKNPRYATGTGLVLCGVRQRQQAWFSARLEKPRSRGFGRIASLFGFA
ncbi:MAG: cell division protein FtsA [Myxococcales bacterium]|nr:cell division protein FtsA [Myxococcales bacterium]